MLSSTTSARTPGDSCAIKACSVAKSPPAASLATETTICWMSAASAVGGADGSARARFASGKKLVSSSMSGAFASLQKG